MEKLTCKVSGLEFYALNNAPLSHQQIVLMIHGAGGTYKHWNAVIHHISDQFFPLMVNLPGHGGSAIIPGIHIFDLANLIHCFLKNRKWNKSINIIGHSLGGLIAQQFAINFSQTVNKVVLISTDSKITLHPTVFEQLKSQIIDHEFIAAGFNHDINQEIINQIVNDFKQVKMSRNSKDLFGESRMDLSQGIQQLEQPILVLMGDKDKVLSPRRTRLLASKLKNATMNVIQNSGHYPHLEQPLEVSGLLNKFLDAR